MTNILWSTPLRPRKGCLRSSIIFTVSLTLLFHGFMQSQSKKKPQTVRCNAQEQPQRCEHLASCVSDRSPEASEDQKQKFTQFSLGNGILADNIVIFPKNGIHIQAPGGSFTLKVFLTDPCVCVSRNSRVPRRATDLSRHRRHPASLFILLHHMFLRP